LAKNHFVVTLSSLTPWAHISPPNIRPRQAKRLRTNDPTIVLSKQNGQTFGAELHGDDENRHPKHV